MKTIWILVSFSTLTLPCLGQNPPSAGSNTIHYCTEINTALSECITITDPEMDPFTMDTIYGAKYLIAGIKIEEERIDPVDTSLRILDLNASDLSESIGFSPITSFTWFLLSNPSDPVVENIYSGPTNNLLTTGLPAGSGPTLSVDGIAGSNDFFVFLQVSNGTETAWASMIYANSSRGRGSVIFSPFGEPVFIGTNLYFVDKSQLYESNAYPELDFTSVDIFGIETSGGTINPLLGLMPNADLTSTSSPISYDFMGSKTYEAAFFSLDVGTPITTISSSNLFNSVSVERYSLGLPSNGSLSSLATPSEGCFTYSPYAGHIGIDSVYYALCDDGANCDTLLTIITTAIDCTLPVEFSNFEVKETRNGEIEIVWSTASETNNDFFSIEKSTDGNQWNTLSTVNGSGNSSTITTYSWIDKTPSCNISFYRLTQHDFNGASKTTRPAVINLDCSSFVPKIYPNPTLGFLTIVSPIKECVPSLYSIDGKYFNLNQFLLQKSENEIKLDLSELPSGIYYLKTVSNYIKILLLPE